jgi:hypothetical protein
MFGDLCFEANEVSELPNLNFTQRFASGKLVFGLARKCEDESEANARSIQ